MGATTAASSGSRPGSCTLNWRSHNTARRLVLKTKADCRPGRLAAARTSAVPVQCGTPERLAVAHRAKLALQKHRDDANEKGDPAATCMKCHTGLAGLASKFE